MEQNRYSSSSISFVDSPESLTINMDFQMEKALWKITSKQSCYTIKYIIKNSYIN